MTIVLVVLLAVGAYGAQFRGSESRIVGGSIAAEGAYPFQVSMHYRDVGRHFCSGSILDTTTVLTAAHCFEGVTDDMIPDLTIYAGSNRYFTGGVSYKILELRSHQDYINSTIGDDIAIVKVDPISFNAKVQPVDLETEFLPADVDCVASGWGSLALGVPGPYDLHELHLKTITTEACKIGLTNTTYTFTVTDKNICTFTKFGEGLCFGDSGGSLTSNNKLIGIVSAGEPCAVGYPDIYPRISAYIDWIEANRY